MLSLFVVLTLAWTWPLVAHLRDSLPGNPGDNFSFVWNLWWMRQVLSTPGLGYFHSNYLFYPFGTTIADHPHTALPALVAATVLSGVSPATAQNTLVLVHVFGNFASMYALAWALTRRHLPSVMAAVVFGASPYIAVHLLGHFDLVAAWVLPLYALFLTNAIAHQSRRSAVAAGLVLGATAYIAYYYVVFLVVLTLVYVVVQARAISTVRSNRAATRGLSTARAALLAVASILAAIAAAIAISGGGEFSIRSFRIVSRTPQNMLGMMWLALLIWGALKWRPAFAFNVRSDLFRSGALAVSIVAGLFVITAAPLLWQTAILVLHHEYVTQQYFWRSAPRGVDLLSPLIGHPLHPIIGSMCVRAYSFFHVDYVESIGWFGIIPLVLLALTARTHVDRQLIRVWRAIAVVFAIWALGPFLTFGGFDTGLRLPAILLRYVPLVANARMPGRAIIVVYMTLAILIACGLSAASGRLRSRAIQCMLIAAVAFEFWIAPMRLTQLTHPAVYDVLARSEPGAVCEVPFGIGDGLGGIGSQDRRVLFYATLHGHPLVGGYIGRMPADAADRYTRMPVVGNLLALSTGSDVRGASGESTDGSLSPCTYLVVHRSESSVQLLNYVNALHSTRIAAFADDELYRLPSR